MSTTSLKAGEVMDRAAALMNDPAKTDYTYLAQIPYLNMSIDELQEQLEEANASPANLMSAAITIPVGFNSITSIDDPTTGQPHYPFDLIEIQEVSERATGSQDRYVPLGRREFIQQYPASNSLLFWTWEDQIIKFNPNGANSSRDIQLKYVRMPFSLATDENSIIGVINARSYLAYKTAAFCAMFVGEDQVRAQALNDQATMAIERMLGINSKGRQEMVTRRRPFRASYKSRGI